jgi:hypothetical protein
MTVVLFIAHAPFTRKSAGKKPLFYYHISKLLSMGKRDFFPPRVIFSCLPGSEMLFRIAIVECFTAAGAAIVSGVARP